MAPGTRPAPREWLLLLVLSGIQFSQMVDFMVLMPLGTQLMRTFDITPTQLGFFVSIYAVAASLAGFFSALVIDRFDRKTAMLALYACFAATMAACALAPSYATRRPPCARRGGRREYFHHRRGRGPGKPARPGLRRGHVGLFARLDPGRADQLVPRAAFH